jgi:purine nucleoside permease
MKKSIIRTSIILFVLIIFTIMGVAPTFAQDDDDQGKRQVKVLTIAMFEFGNITGDFPGEAQRWAEGEGLNQVVDVPGLLWPVYCNSANHCIVITGVGFSNAASSIAILGSYSKLDLSQAYILIAGIAGVDPADGTLGSAAWADWVVNGDLAHHIDAREMPKTFSYPLFRLGCTTDPNQPFCTGGRTWGSEVFQLNTNLVDWAYNLTKDLTLNDSAQAQAYRALYKQASATAPPSVIRCDSLGADRYWHGKLLSDWANWWVQNWTNGQGNYCMTNQEDAATITALYRLSLAGRVDFNRVLVLRTASNFDQQHTKQGQTAYQSVGTSSGGFFPSGDNAYIVGSAVTDYIIQNWNVWKNCAPPFGN